MHTDPNCIFCKIAAGQIPAKKIYEDDELIAFHDIHPAAPIHFMIVPKEHVESLAHTHAQHEQLLGRIMVLAPRLAKEQGAREGQEGGFRVVINTGRDGGQEVFHLHVHVLAGPRPWTRMA
ncbi:MAG TPA: histidine triad nucleotide-binding protein [Burkholderiales bacterium]|jgi:histidine triad (HIT) family protein